MAATLSDRKAHYAEHHSRHAGLISLDQQEVIPEKTILIAGCGVGSLVALSAARLGFEKFILVDGDRVEKTNINRQGYSHSDIGEYKARALADRIRLLNPHAVCHPHAEFVTIENAEEFVSKADIIVDAIDPEASIAEIALQQAARKQDKMVIQPSDLGWGAILHIFAPDGMTYEEALGLEKGVDPSTLVQEELVGRIVQHYVQYMPPYVQGITMDYIEGKINHFPQPVSAAYTVAAMAVTAIRRIALGLPVKVAPEYIAFDPEILLTPTE